MDLLNSSTMDTLTRFAVISLQQRDYSVVFRTRSRQLSKERGVCYT
jgi:hypothetical protein